MIEIKNLRIEDMPNNWTRVVADIDFVEMVNPYTENTVWFATRTENREMLTQDNYDAFVLVPLYLAMYYRQDLHICGKVSKRLYKNIMTYIQTILCEFSNHLSRINVIIDGYADVIKREIGGGIIGTGISCGVDSLSTIYDHFVKETDTDYRINALFLFNTGTHGAYEDPKTKKLYESRYLLNKRAADEMGLPVYQVDTNLHAFTHKIGEQRVGYFSLWSCILAMEKVVRLYYTSSTYSYEEIKHFSDASRNFDMAEFCESYLIPLIRTEQVELLVDGCQYRRSQKTENVSDWDIARKHLNVCVNSEDGHNCGYCSKCMRTLIPLDAMGKLEAFSDVFDLDVYRRHAYVHKLYFRGNINKIGFARDITDYCREKHYAMPPVFLASLYMFYIFLRECVSYIIHILMRYRVFGWLFRKIIRK